MLSALGIIGAAPLANAQGRTSSPSTSGSTQRESNSTIRTSSYFAESNTSGITVTPQLEAMLSPEPGPK